jgi:hypothetical protein
MLTVYEEHARFETPADPTAPIWRYMDFAKFVSLLHRQALFFPTAASLGDPYEGSYPAANVRLRPSWYGEHAANAMETQVRPEKLRRLHTTLISCWHMNEVESAAMWHLYAKEGYGIAIRSSYTRLRQAISTAQPFYIGVVKYLAYESDPMPEGNLFDPFLHKRTSFAHERELRVITERYVAPGTTTTWRLSEGPPPYFGDYIPTDLGALVESVYLAPSSPHWFVDAVSAAADRFGLTAAVRRSDLDAPPSY